MANNKENTRLRSYKERFVQMDKEALATVLASAAITLYFWLSIWLFKDSAVTVLSLPLWFMLSCIGGYLLSIIAVFILVRRCMKNFPLD